MFDTAKETSSIIVFFVSLLEISGLEIYFLIYNSWCIKIKYNKSNVIINNWWICVECLLPNRVNRIRKLIFLPCSMLLLSVLEILSFKIVIFPFCVELSQLHFADNDWHKLYWFINFINSIYILFFFFLISRFYSFINWHDAIFKEGNFNNNKSWEINLNSRLFLKWIIWVYQPKGWFLYLPTWI